jgi:hypothetical protein
VEGSGDGGDGKGGEDGDDDDDDDDAGHDSDDDEIGVCCPACTFVNKASAQVCNMCERPLTRGQGPPPPQPQPNGNGEWTQKFVGAKVG